ncbi:MAG TPA: hypothetical protein VJH92_01385 [Candidatus Nanoarchaeia archaeon]|nr:hypothetical protein [Candidatus Nanoarchaeia archaeon]
MAGEELINRSVEIVPDLVVQAGKLAILLQALGVILVLWLIFNMVSLVINLRKKKILEEIQKDIKRLENKVDKLK